MGNYSSTWLTKKLKNLDILGEGINFTINNQPQFKTVGFLRLSLIILGIFLFFFFGRDFVFKKNQKIYYEIKESLKPLEFTYTANDFFFTIRCINTYYRTVDISDYFHLEASYYKYTKNATNVTIREINVPLVKCSEITFDKQTENFFKNLYKTEFFCPKFNIGDNINIIGNWNDFTDIVFSMEIKLKICLNFENNTATNCKNYKKFFSESSKSNDKFIELIMKDVKFYKDNVENPLTKTFGISTNSLSNNILKRGYSYLSKSHVIQDDGKIFES
jgi:hypothetical protein